MLIHVGLALHLTRCRVVCDAAVRGVVQLSGADGGSKRVRL